VLVLDRSGSLQGREAELERALRQATGLMSPSDRVGVVAFADRGAEWVPLGPTTRPQLDQIDWLPQGGSNLFDGLQAGLSLLRREGRPGSQWVLRVVTDRDPNTGVVDPEGFAAWAQQRAAEGIELELVVLEAPGPVLQALSAGAVAGTPGP
jgi:Mg-chelatase subunit ChlD